MKTPAMESKRCAKCRLDKPHEDYYWTTRRNGLKARHSICKKCRKLQFQEWSKTQTGAKRQRPYQLKTKFGISIEDYDSLLTAQKGVCAICGVPETKKHGRAGTPLMLSVDHDHETGIIRGLLCSACNMGLGSFRDNPELLSAAIAYLKLKKPTGSESGEKSAGTVAV